MITPLSWIKEHLKTKANFEQIVDRLTAIGLEVENIKSVTLVWHFIQHGIKVESKRTNEGIRKVINETKKSIDEIRGKLSNGGEFSPKKSILCNWCYYWEECPTQYGSNPYIQS